MRRRVTCCGAIALAMMMNAQPQPVFAPSIRMMDAGDIAAVSQLAARIWRAHYPGIISHEQIEHMLTRMYAPQVLSKQRQQGHECWLIEKEAALVGFAGIEPIGAEKYFLHKFYIDQDRAGSGLGKILMRHVLAHYQPRELQLHVNRKNFKAINFYFAFGFVIDSLIVTDIGQGFVMDDFRMKKHNDSR